MSNGNPQYDVFISYKSEYKPWVETLARNLERQRLTVWLDDWRKRPGDLIAGTLDNAIKSSRAGVLVVTPEAVASGWVQEEYESMLAREKKGGFRLIPAILRKSEGFPFLRNRFWIDFTAPEHAGAGRREVRQPGRDRRRHKPRVSGPLYRHFARRPQPPALVTTRSVCGT